MGLTKILCRAVAIVTLCIWATSVSGQENRKALFKPAPTYPEIARHLGLTGTVKIEITISPDGHVKNTNVLGGHPVLISVALDAVKKWKYEPAKTESTVTVQFDFHP